MLRKANDLERRAALGDLSYGFNGNPATNSAYWVWLKIKQEGQTARLGPCFHLPGFHFGYRFFEPQPTRSLKNR